MGELGGSFMTKIILYSLFSLFLFLFLLFLLFLLLATTTISVGTTQGLFPNHSFRFAREEIRILLRWLGKQKGHRCDGWYIWCEKLI
jgi:hypothetical protein